MSTRTAWILGSALPALLTGGIIALAQVNDAKKTQNKAEEQERKVQEAEVPKAPLEALKKLADKNAITEFAEEIEHGSKFYEGSWKGPGGNIDALVTETGDLVEIEETITAEKAPAKVRAQAEKLAGKDAKVTFEKKTLILYEIHFDKGGKENEAMFTPDGRTYHEEQDEDKENDKDK